MSAFDPKRTFEVGILVLRALLLTCRDPAIFAAVLGLCLCMTACSSQVAKDTTPSPDESILVLGLDQQNTYVAFRPGATSTVGTPERPIDVFQESLGPGGFFMHPENGFLLAKVQGGQTFGLVMIRFAREEENTPRVYQPCPNGDLLFRGVTVDVPKGKVLYLGHFDYLVDNYSLALKHRWDWNSAMAYVNKTFPALQGRLEVWDYKTALMVISKTRCTPGPGGLGTSYRLIAPKPATRF